MNADMRRTLPGRFGSLKELKQLAAEIAERKALAAAQAAAAQAARLQAQRQASAASLLFARAVGKVSPLKSSPRTEHSRSLPQPVAAQRRLDEQAVLREALSDGFDVATLLDTDETLSFTRAGLGPDVPRRLRRGDWSIQRQLDLHGLRRDDAREQLSAFIRESHQAGLRCVRVVHGKGLGSPGKTPVLKGRVQSWLVQKSEVLAFVQGAARRWRRGRARGVAQTRRRAAGARTAGAGCVSRAFAPMQHRRPQTPYLEIHHADDRHAACTRRRATEPGSRLDAGRAGPRPEPAHRAPRLPKAIRCRHQKSERAQAGFGNCVAHRAATLLPPGGVTAPYIRARRCARRHERPVLRSCGLKTSYRKVILMTPSSLSKLVLAAIPLIALTACSGGSSVGNVIGTANPQVRLANVSPIAPSLTLQRNTSNRNEATNVPYPTITNYFDVDTGTADYTVVGLGSGTNFTQSFDAQRGHKYTILAVADSPTTTSLAPQLNDPTNLSIVSDQSRVRVFNGSYNAQNIDVYTIGQQQTITSLQPDLPNIGFKNSNPANGTDSIGRRGGDYKIVVTTAGTKNILFQGNYTIRDRQNVLFVTVPVLPGNGQAATGVALLAKQGDDTTVAVPSL